MKHSFKRLLSMMMALTMILSCMPLSLAEGLPEEVAPVEEIAPVVLEQAGEPAEESAEDSSAEGITVPVEPDAIVPSEENPAPKEQTEVLNETAEETGLTGESDGESSYISSPEGETAEPEAEEAPQTEDAVPEEQTEVSNETPEENSLTEDSEEESSGISIPEEKVAEPETEEKITEEEPKTPAIIPEKSEEEPSDINVPEEKTAETEAEKAPAKEEPAAPIQEEPEVPDTVPVDATLRVGGSWRGTFDGERDAFLLRLTVKERQNVQLTTDGLPVAVRLSNEVTDNSRTFKCKYDSEAETWNPIFADFELEAGSYLIAVTPIQEGSTGNVSLSILPQPTEDEIPTDDEVPAEEATSVEGEAPAEDETPVENETPAEDETPAENVTPSEDGVPAENETSAEDVTPAEVADTFPAVVLTQTMPDGTVITVTAPEGALPDGVQMRAVKVVTVEALAQVLQVNFGYEEEASYAAAAEIINEGMADVIMKAYDICFYLPEQPDVELEPAKKVDVQFQYADFELNQGENLQVYHMDDETGDLDRQRVQIDNNEDELSATISSDQFSTYITAKSVPGTSSGSGNTDLASYIEVEAPVKRDATNPSITAQDGWYDGVITAKIPLSALMEYAYQQYLSGKSLAALFNKHAASWYISQTYNKITMTVTFPGQVEIDGVGASITTDSTNIFRAFSAPAVSGNTVTITPTIRYDKFGNLFENYYLSQKDSRFVYVTIPYSVYVTGGSGYASAPKITITGSGRMEAEASSMVNFTVNIKKISLPEFTEGYGAWYQFVSNTESAELPDSVMALLPNDPRGYGEGDPVKPVIPSQLKVAEGDGFWLFDGYTPKSAVFTEDDITFTGGWSRNASEPLYLHYDFMTSYAGDDYVAADYLPAECLELLEDVRRTAAGRYAFAGGAATPVIPDKTVVTTDDGTWTFRGYMLDREDLDLEGSTLTSVQMEDTDVDLMGIWDFEPTMYRVQFNYTFVNNTEDNAEQPREEVEYSDYIYRNGQKVTPTKPGSVKVYNDEETWTGNWTYGNYSPTSAVISGDKSTDGTFIGATYKSTVTYTRQTYTWQVRHYFAGTSQLIYNGGTSSVAGSLTGLLTLPTNRSGQYDTTLSPSCTLKTEGVDSFSDLATYYNGVFTFDHMDTSEIVIGPEHNGSSTIYVPVYWKFEPYMHDVVVTHTSATSGRTISPSVLEQMNAEINEPLQRSRYYFDEASQTWKSVNYKLTNYYPAYKSIKYTDKTGNNDGTWAYYENAKSGETTYTVSDLKTADAVITVTYKWAYTANTHKIIYQFVDEKGNDLNNNAGAKTNVVTSYSRGTLSNAAYIFNYTYTISPKAAIPAAGKFDSTNDGVWYFDGWFIREKDENGYDVLDEEGNPILVAAPSDLKVKIGRGDLYVVGKWHMVPIDHRVTYTYSSGTKNVALPAALAAMVPVDETIYHKGDVVTLLPEETEFDSGNGYKWVLTRSVTASYTNTSNKAATKNVADSFSMFTTYQTKTTVKLPRVWTRMASTAHKVIWNNWNDNELNYAYVALNAAPTYTTKPTRAADEEYRYVFAGWQKEGSDQVVTTFPKVTSADPDPIIYTAVFTPVRQYTVVFQDDDGTELQAGKVDAGATPVYSDGAPAHTSDDPMIAYEFLGWTKDGDETIYGTEEHPLPAVDGDVTYTAVFERVAPTFDVRFLNEDGTAVLQSGKVQYGEMPAYTGNPPTKEGTSQYTYIFAGWDKELAAVTENVDYKATFTQEIRKYNIRWYDGDGKLLATDAVEYETIPSYSSENPVPTKTRTNTTIYTFNSTWTPEIKAVTGDAEYTAQFTETERTYTVTWMDSDGVAVLASRPVSYADFTAENLATKSGVTPQKAEDARALYTFDHFELTTNLEDSKTFTAVYTETIKKYSVKYVFQQNAADKISLALPEAVTAMKPEDTQVDYDTVLTMNTPEAGKSVDDTHGKWRFEGWDKTGEQTVKAAVTFTGTWTYAANGLDVNYRFASTDEAWPITETVTALVPTPAVGSDGTQFVLAVPENTSVDEIQSDVTVGTWRFQGWKLSAADETYTEQVMLDGTVVNAIGYWTFTPASMNVTYTFAPAEGSPDFTTDANYDADKTALAGKLPETGTAPYGSQAQPAEIAEEDRTVNGTYGKWTFRGWMAKDADENLVAVPDSGQTVTTSGAAFTGLWAYTHDTHTVGYLYLSNDGTALPEQVTAKAAELTQVSAKPYGSETEAPVEVGGIDDGTVVNVLQPETMTTRVNVDNGTWVLVEDSWKLATSSSVTDISALQDIPGEGVTVVGDVWFTALWRFVPNSEKRVTLTLHDGIDEAHNKEVTLNPADETLMNLPAHPFGTTVVKDGKTYRFIGWRSGSALFEEGSVFYLYADGAPFRFSNPGILMTPVEAVRQSFNHIASAAGTPTTRAANLDKDNLAMRGDLYGVWLIESPAVTAQMDLYGDLLVNDDTEHEAVPAVKTGDTVTISAELNAAPVKEQIQSIYDSYDEPRAAELNKAAITLSDVSSTFTVKVHSVGVDLSKNTVETLNSGLDWTEDDVNGATFAVTGLEQVEGAEGDWIITITLQNADKLTTFDDLYQLIHDNMKDGLVIAADGDVTQAGGYARVTGTVEGTFYGKATLANTDAQGSVVGYHAIPFSFVWKGVQDPETSDKLNPKPISVTMQVKPEITLPGDLAVTVHGGKTFDTEHTAVYMTRPGTSLDFNASLKVSAVKEQMLAVEGDYEDRASDFEAITFANGVQCVFNVELNVQNGLTLPTNKNAYTLDDTNFTIDSVTVRGNTAGIKISFKTKCNNYAELHDAIINKTADVLNLRVSGVQAGNTAGAARMVGTVSGEFAATAVLNTQQIPFAFTWKGTQDKEPDGSDFVLGENPDGIIQLTVQIKPEVELPGDLLVAMSGESSYDTEHDGFFATAQDAPMDYLASLKVGKVFQQMQDLVGDYGQHNPELENQLSLIELLEQGGKRVDCTFTAVFTAQHGLSLANVDPDAVTLKNPGKFSITDTKLNTSGNNHTLTVTMTYAPNGVTNFLELYNDIGNMANAEVQLLIPGITAEIPAGTLYLQGTVEGSFAATARFNNSVIPFAFDWKGVQDKDPDGSDFVLGTNPDSDIQLTVQVVPVVDLPGDVQLRHHGQTAFTTEHDQVYTAKPGEKLDYAAVLDVSSIKELITEIGEYYADRGADEQDQILLSNLSCTFDVTVTAQPGLDLSKATFALPDSGSFSLSVVSRSATRAQLKCTFSPNGMDTFDKLLENITSMPDLLVLNVDNVGLPASTEIPMALTLSGTVGGLFHGDATYGGRTIPFDFQWNGVQEHDMDWTAPESNAGLAVSGDGQDAILGTTPVDTIQATVVVTPVVVLPGDLQIRTPAKGDAFTTEHEQAYFTEAGAELTYAATLDVSAIKGQLKAVKNAYSRISDTGAISLHELACGFTVTLTADPGLDISKATFALENTDSFQITDRKLEDQTVTLTLTYVTDPDNFTTLFDDIDSLPNMLLLTATGVKVIAPAGPAVMTGTIDGDFYAMAEYNGTRIPFAFIWSGEQDHALTATGAQGIETGKNGSDALLPEETETIQLTVVAAPEVELPGDLQVKNPAKGDDFTTEHEQVYITEPGATLTYAAILNVAQIKEQLVGEEEYYTNEAEAQGKELTLKEILLSKLESKFVVTLTADSGLTLPEDIANYQLNNGGNFVVTEAKVNGQTATITIEYKAQPANFLALKQDITAMDDLLELDIAGVKVPETTMPLPLTVKGEVSGDFYSVATLKSHVIPFAFIWNGTQDHVLEATNAPAGLELGKDGQDAILGSKEQAEIQLTVVAAPEVELPGDLQVKENEAAFTTEHEQVYITGSGATLTYAATLNVTQIKEQLLGEEDYYTNEAENQGKELPLEEILLSELESKFVVTLTADPGLTLPEGADNYQLKNGGSFAVTKVEVSGETATITIEYKAQPANFQALKQDITAMDDLLELDIAGVKVLETTMPLSLTMKGEVNGDFYAVATLKSHVIPFAFIWNGTQDHTLKATKIPAGLELNKDGQDAILGSDEQEQIWLTVAVAPGIDLPGDLQVHNPAAGDNLTTEHTEIYKTYEGTELDYAATLNVKRVFNQMLGIEENQAESHGLSLQELQERFGKIELKDLKSSFTVTLTADAGLTLPGSLSGYELVNEHKGLFTITDVKVNGQTATLTITYDKDGTIADYAQLAQDIQKNVDELLQLNIIGVKVAAKAPEQYLTIRGDVTGEFYSLATARNITMAFAFKWSGTQDHKVIAGKYGNDTGEGLDYIIDNDIENGAKAKDSDIWVTVEVRTDARVTKVWEDNNDQDGIRPESLTVALNGEEITLTAADAAQDNPNQWSRTVSDLPKFADGKEITYTWTEAEQPDGYRLGSTTVDADNRNTTFMNVHEPERVDVTVEKIWDDAENQDGIRPDTVRLSLLANGRTVASASIAAAEGNRWTYTFRGMDKYAAGQEITYTVLETEVPEGYTAAHSGLTVTNTHKPAVTEITGTKVWMDNSDNDGLRPESITVRLLADGEVVQTRRVTGDDWSFSFSNLPVYRDGKLITYTVDEDAVPEYEKTITGNAVGSFIITNTHDVTTTTVSGVKVWDDDNDRDDLRPDSITVNLLANGETVATQTVTGVGNVWFYTFTGLNRYAGGEPVTYTVTEEPVNGYVTNINGTTITNTHRPTAVRLTVRYFYVNGTVAAPTVFQDHQPGDPYDVISPVIPNYVASVLRVSGTMPDRDVEYAVIYTPAPNRTPGMTTIEIEELETPLGLGNTSLNTGECFE